MDNTFELKWHSHANHFQNLIKNLLQSEDQSDVTLVCDDQVKLKAHKLILKSCSPVFESIFSNNDSAASRETIYLHGVSHLDMKPILDYIYQGKVSLDVRRMINFKEVAKNLKIKDAGEFMEVPLPPNTYTPVQVKKQFSKIISNDNVSDIKQTLVNIKPSENSIQKKLKTLTLELVKHETFEDVKQLNEFTFSEEGPKKEKENHVTKCKDCKQILNNEEVHKCKYLCEEPGCEDIIKYSKSYFNTHKYTFHGQESLTCEDCGETFKHSIILNIHKKKNCKLAEKTVCKVCGISVKRLNRHMAQHIPEEQRGYVCHFDNCRKGFIQKNVLDQHLMNVHLKLRPYKCRYGCDFGYNDPSNRDSHEKKKHGKLYVSSKRVQQKPNLPEYNN